MTEMRWRGTSHEEMYRMINTGEGSRASGPQLDYWSGLDRKFTDIHRHLNDKLSNLNGGWQGNAGQRAQNALRPLQRWAEDVQGHVNGMRGVVQHQADLIADARARMPEPQPHQPPQPAGWPGPGESSHGRNPASMLASHGADFEVKESAAGDAREQAIRVMSNYERNSEINRGSLGIFEEPAKVAVEVPEPTNSSSFVGLRQGTAPTAPTEGTPMGGNAPASEAPPGRVPGEPPAPRPGGTAGWVIREQQGAHAPGSKHTVAPEHGGWRVPSESTAPKPPGALTGTVSTAGGLGAVTAGGAGGMGGRRGGAHRKQDESSSQDAPQWPGEQDNPDSAGNPDGQDNQNDQGNQNNQGNPANQGVPGDGSHGGGGQQQTLPGQHGGQPQQDVTQSQQDPGQPVQNHTDPLQPAQHADVNLGATQGGNAQQAPAVDPVQPQQHAVAPQQQAPQSGLMRPSPGDQMFSQPGHSGSAPIAPMTGGGGMGGGAGGQGAAVRGQSPLMRDASAGNQFFHNGSGGSYNTSYGTDPQSAGYNQPQGGGNGGQQGGHGGNWQAGAQPGHSQHTQQERDYRDDPYEEADEEFDVGFSEPVSNDADPFWGDDRRVAPPVLGEFPQQ